MAAQRVLYVSSTDIMWDGRTDWFERVDACAVGTDKEQINLMTMVLDSWLSVSVDRMCKL